MKKYLKAAEHLSRFHDLTSKAEVAEAKALELRVKANAAHTKFRETVVMDPDLSGAYISLEIPLAEYLAAYPDAQPARKSCECGEYLAYPEQAIGEGVSVWAKTACV